jgi:hypothetical protein
MLMIQCSLDKGALEKKLLSLAENKHFSDQYGKTTTTTARTQQYRMKTSLEKKEEESQELKEEVISLDTILNDINKVATLA